MMFFDITFKKDKQILVISVRNHAPEKYDLYITKDAPEHIITCKNPVDVLRLVVEKINDLTSTQWKQI